MADLPYIAYGGQNYHFYTTNIVEILTYIFFFSFKCRLTGTFVFIII